MLEFTTCEPIKAQAPSRRQVARVPTCELIKAQAPSTRQVARVHHMRTNRSTGSKHKRSTKQPHNQHVCLRGSPRCELHCRRERDAAHEDPELTVNHEEATSQHGHNAAFQGVDRTLRRLAWGHLKFQVKVRSNWTKESSERSGMISESCTSFSTVSEEIGDPGVPARFFSRCMCNCTPCTWRSSRQAKPLSMSHLGSRFDHIAVDEMLLVQRRQNCRWR